MPSQEVKTLTTESMLRVFGREKLKGEVELDQDTSGGIIRKRRGTAQKSRKGQERNRPARKARDSDEGRGRSRRIRTDRQSYGGSVGFGFGWGGGGGGGGVGFCL